jgi:hypothetical protein
MPVDYYVKIQGCVVSLMSKNSKANVLRRLLVNPVWIELWHLISEDKFDMVKWNRLTPTEKNFMMLLAQKLNIQNRELHSSNNNEAATQIERLKLLEGSILSGNLNKEILDEATSIIDDLADRSMLYRRTANSLKKRFNQAYAQTNQSFDTLKQLRRR